MAVENKDVKRVHDTAAVLEAGGIILDQWGFATDTKQVIVRDAGGYYRMAGIDAANTFTGLNVFSANVSLGGSVIRPDDTTVHQFFAGTGLSTDARIRMYGPNHATLPDQIDFAQGGSVKFEIDTNSLITTKIVDNSATAYTIEDANTDNYFLIKTSNGTEHIYLGNTTTNPDLTLLGTGNMTIGGVLKIDSQLTINSNGNAIVDMAVDNDNNETGQDAVYRIFNNGSATATWAWGMDDSDSDAYVISRASNTLGINNAYKIDSSGNHTYFGDITLAAGNDLFLSTTSDIDVGSGNFTVSGATGNIGVDNNISITGDGIIRWGAHHTTSNSGMLSWDTNKVTIGAFDTGTSLELRTENTTAITIDVSQNVGIGLTPTDEVLEVQGGMISKGAGATFGNDGTFIDYNAGQSRIAATRNGANAGYLSFYTTNTSGSTIERVQIQAAGHMSVLAGNDLLLSTTSDINVGSGNFTVDGATGNTDVNGDLTIGGATITTALNVLETAVNSATLTTTNAKQLGIYVPASGASNVTGQIQTGIAFGEGTAGIYAMDDGSLAANAMGFFTGSVGGGITTNAFIDSSGNFGIGAGIVSVPNHFYINGVAIANPATSADYSIALDIAGVDSLRIGADASYAYIQSWSTKPLKLNDQGNDVLVGGLLSVGDDTPEGSGLTINQGANDDIILSLKSSDVAHGMTTISETDTYGFIDKYDATMGGLQITGMGETGGIPLTLNAYGGAAESIVSSVLINAAYANGTGVTDVPDADRVLRIENNGSEIFKIMGDGDTTITALAGSGTRVVKASSTGELSAAGATVDVPVSFEIYDPSPTNGSEENIHGGLLSLATGQPLNSVPTNIVVTKGTGKLMIVINAGSDFAGSITITGDTIDRDTGAKTVADTDTITVDALTTDASDTDGNGNPRYSFTGAYCSSKWFTGSVTLSTADMTLTDVDVYHVSFEQFNDIGAITLDTFDVNLFTKNANAQFDGYLYTLEATTGDKCDIVRQASLNVGTDGETAIANKYWRERRGGLAVALDTTTDGIWTDLFYSNSPANVSAVTMKVWATRSETVT